MKNLLLGDYLNIGLRSHPQKTLTCDTDSRILVLNSGERIYFFDLISRITTGSSGLIKTIKRQDILNTVKFGEPIK
jgi:hypothetical protein